MLQIMLQNGCATALHDAIMCVKMADFGVLREYCIEGLHSPSRYCDSIKHLISVLYAVLTPSATSIATNTAAFFLAATLMKDSTRSQFPYKLCVIRDRGGDLSKRWYVEFYVWDISKGKLARKTDYDVNKHKTTEKRYQAAAKIKSKIDSFLKKGAYIESSAKPALRSSITRNTAFMAAVQKIYAEKAVNTNSKRTLSAYISYKNIFKEWCDLTGFGNHPFTSFTTAHIRDMMTWYKSRTNRNGEPVSNTSRNNFLIQVKSIFNDLVNRKLIEESPANEVKWLNQSSKHHVPYFDREADKIKEYLETVDKQMLMVCQIIYYTAVRRSELRLLQIGFIRGNKIFIPESLNHSGENERVSKSGKSTAVTLPIQLIKSMEENHIFNYPPEYFIFGKEGVPSEKPTSINFFTNKYKKLVLDHFGFTGGQTLYSWKHTAACKLYKRFKDPKMIQDHFRHSKLETTLIYLRNLGMFDEGELEEQYPEF